MKVDKDQISAWGVHAFTGSGAILGFLALVSILNNDQNISSSNNVSKVSYVPVNQPSESQPVPEPKL